MSTEYQWHYHRLDGVTPVLPWVESTGTSRTRSRKAAAYLKVFDYAEAAQLDSDTVILAKVVCNLRNYYKQSADETAELVRSVFNPRACVKWSPEEIKLAWDVVEGFTPSLGLADEMAVARHRAAMIENEVIDLLSWTIPGDRVSCEDFCEVFSSWNPGIDTNPYELGRAVKAVTGIPSTVSNGKRYYKGFRFPTAVELSVTSQIAA